GVELYLAQLYSFCAERPNKVPSIRLYGEGSTFKGRSLLLRGASETFFRKHPDQTLEADFDKLMELVRNYADRRHDVAHGVVRQFEWEFPDPLGRPTTSRQYCLVPPHY